MIKVNKKVKKLRNKPDRVFLRVLCVIVKSFIVSGFFCVIVSAFYWHCCELNDHTRVTIPCTNINGSVHSFWTYLFL